VSRGGSPRRAALRLLTGAAFTVVIWCGVLPRVLVWPPVARHVALMEDRRVDPAAMYYTELERLPQRPDWIERRLVLWP